MKHGIEELLTFRTKERDRFEAECHRLRRERDNAREEMQWLALLTVIESPRTILYEEILRPLWLPRPLPCLAAIRANIRRAHCEHPDSAMDIKSDPVATLVCNDCKAEVVASGVMTRLLEEQKNAPQVIHAPATITVNGIQIGTFQDGEFTDTGPPMDPIAELQRVTTAEELVRTFGTPSAPPPAGAERQERAMDVFHAGVPVDVYSQTQRESPPVLMFSGAFLVRIEREGTATFVFVSGGTPSATARNCGLNPEDEHSVHDESNCPVGEMFWRLPNSGVFIEFRPPPANIDYDHATATCRLRPLLDR